MAAEPAVPARRDRIRFLLDGEMRSIEVDDPTMTVLDHLRLVERRCGTKEGCAEGDCGACTVVLAERDGDRLRHRAVNACILFLPILDGKQLLTVESLAPPGAPLHPVQQAMVDCHASQCGFCTPGFVMSIYALWRAGLPPDRALIDTALAGNLCRCTGYRPIVEAAARVCAETAPDRSGDAAVLAQLDAIRPAGDLECGPPGRRFFAPSGLGQLARLVLDHPDALLLAGGTDIGLWVTKQNRLLGPIIQLGGVAELRRITVADGMIEIGAAVSYGDALDRLGAYYPDLGELFRRLGSVQIRNAGTIGGNIGNASPIGDSMPALIALGATLRLRRGATVRDLPLDQFFPGYRQTALAPGEFIQSIRLAVPPPDLVFRAYKISKRFDQDISAVCGAFALRLEGDIVAEIRLGFGGMAATPARARRCEARLLGRRWTEAAVAQALPALDEDFVPISDMRASAAYRRLVAGNLLRKFQLESAAGIRLDVLALAAS